MNRWKGKVAIVTGASSGIGAAIASDLVTHGLQVIGLARRIDRLESLADSLKTASGKLHPLKCDLSNEEDILQAFTYADKKLGGVDIVINCAGVLHESLLGEGTTKSWRSMIDVNIMGLSICTREALKSMKQKGMDQGHIIHINSLAGHYDVVQPGFHMYSATKHAVTALTEGLRRELVDKGSKIRVTSISPGLVDTEILRRGTVDNVDADELYKKAPSLNPKDISDAVLYVLGTPPHVQIHELTIQPVGEVKL